MFRLSQHKETICERTAQSSEDKHGDAGMAIRPYIQKSPGRIVSWWHQAVQHKHHEQFQNHQDLSPTEHEPLISDSCSDGLSSFIASSCQGFDF